MLKNNKPVVCFRFPKENSLQLISQLKTPRIDDLSTYFIFHPFQKTHKDPLIKIYPDIWLKGKDIIADSEFPENQNKFEQEPEPDLAFPSSPLLHEDAKKNYLLLISQLVDLLREYNELEKVVLSRCKYVQRSAGFDEFSLFVNLCKGYQEAFVYLLYHPTAGLWVGASPEKLISISKSKLTSMALAGTLEKTTQEVSPSWTSKELEEHYYVSSYMEDCFADFKLEIAHKKGPYTYNSGNLLHLRTDFEVDIQRETKFNLNTFLNEFHPTPAVCGYPKAEALKYILDKEQHERQYYTGYLGLVENDNMDTYVNLRCMRVYQNYFQIFAGGGITAFSKPEEEWVETEVKARTLLSVIEKMQNLDVGNDKVI